MMRPLTRNCLDGELPWVVPPSLVFLISRWRLVNDGAFAEELEGAVVVAELVCDGRQGGAPGPCVWIVDGAFAEELEGAVVVAELV